MTDSPRCLLCRQEKPIVLNDGDPGIGYCEDCEVLAPPLARARREYIALSLFMTTPYLVGDKVECRTAGIWLDGTGTVVEVDRILEHGGTPVYPTFHVNIENPINDDSPTDGWYTEVCLRKVS